MKIKNIAIIGFSLGFGVMCFVWGVLWMVMCLDYKEQVSKLEQDLIDYKWQLEQVPYICMGGEHE
ncbi:MAG: hypothetical protein ACI31R_05540 [Bacilli bacterium]